MHTHDAGRHRKSACPRARRDLPLGPRRLSRRPPLLSLPSLPQLLAASQHILLRVFKTLVNLRPLNRVARTAAGHQVFRIFLPLLRARNNKVHAHHQRVLKTGPSIQPAILAAVIIPLQNRQALLQSRRLVYQGKRRDIQRHEQPPNRKSFGQGRKWECADSRLSWPPTIWQQSGSVKSKARQSVAILLSVGIEHTERKSLLVNHN